MTRQLPLPSPDALLADVPHPAFVKDGNFRFVAVNDAFLEIFGFRRDAVLGKRAMDVFGADEAREEREVLILGTARTATVQCSGQDYRFRLHREGSLAQTALLVGKMDAASRRLPAAAPMPAMAEASSTDDLSSIAHHMASGVIVFDRDLKALAINDVLYRIWQIDPSDFGIGDSLGTFANIGRKSRLYPLDDETWSDHIGNVESSMIRHDVPHRDIPLLDGRTICASGVALSEGRVLVTFDDVSLRDHSVESVAALRHAAEASERLLRTILDNIPAAVVVYDKDNNFVLDNEMRHTMMPSYDEVMRPESTLADFVDFVHENRIITRSEDPELDAIHDTDPDVWKEARLEQYNAAFRTIEHQGIDNRWLKVTDRRLENGMFIRMMADIAELKERETTLAKLNAVAQTSLKTLRAAIEAMPDGMAIWDSKDRFIIWNCRFADQFPGVEVRPGKTMLDALVDFARTGVVPDAMGREEEWGLEKYREWRLGLNNEHVFETHDGRWIKRIDRCTHDGVRVGLRMDVTELKVREIELERARNLAEMAERSKSEFLANMSHEIRTPMNGILGMAEILSRTELDERQRKFAGVISTSGNALLTIINDILDFSKIDAGQLSLHPEPFQLSRAIDDVATLLATRSMEKDLEVIVRIAPTVPDRLIGDTGRLRQIITNLMGNAVKFTEKGHVLIDIDAVPGRPDAEDRETVSLTFRVIDTGIGIPEDRLDDVFSKFSQVDTSSTRQHEGTGLGLAISMRLVELMGGEIGCESVVGEGSTFWFTVPLPIDGSECKPKVLPTDLSGARVLVIDDNPVNRSILLEQLDAWGFDGLAAASGDEGLSVLRDRHGVDSPFDAVVLDYQMPHMNGMQVAHIIRQDDALSGTPIVMLTSIDLDIGSSEFLALHVDGYLVKPARSAVLLKAIIAAIHDPASRRSQAEDGAEAARDSDWESVPAQENEAPAEKAPDVLVAEDNRINQLIVREVLGALGLSCFVAENGLEAVEAYRIHRPRLVLMDVTMPKMDGHEATGRIREIEGDGPRTPIIGATAHASEQDRMACLEAGMDDYISKPISHRDLQEKIRLWLGGDVGLKSA